MVVRFALIRAKSFADSEIAKLGRVRRIELIAPSLSSVPKVLVGTRRISVMHRRLAAIHPSILPLVVQPLPFQVGALREVIQFHHIRAGDTGVQWLKSRILSVASSIA